MGDEVKDQRKPTIEERVTQLRKNIKEEAQWIQELKRDYKDSEHAEGENVGEVMANLTLCYRHLEDASMRLGKALQALDGRFSVYTEGNEVIPTPEQ